MRYSDNVILVDKVRQK